MNSTCRRSTTATSAPTSIRRCRIRAPADASALYARNVLNFLALSLNLKTGDFALARDDEIVKATIVCDDGAVIPRG